MAHAELNLAERQQIEKALAVKTPVAEILDALGAGGVVAIRIADRRIAKAQADQVDIVVAERRERRRIAGEVVLPRGVAEGDDEAVGARPPGHVLGRQFDRVLPALGEVTGAFRIRRPSATKYRSERVYALRSCRIVRN